MAHETMSRLARLWRNLVHRSAVERDLQAEVEAYVDLLTDANVRAGMTPRAARRAALASIGGSEQTKESVREIRIGHTLETLGQDLRYGFRLMARNRMFTSVIVATLAIGIGANTAIFNVVNGALLRPLPFSDPDRLVAIGLRLPSDPLASVPDYVVTLWRSRSRTLEGLESWTQDEMDLTGSGEPERLHCAEISGGLMSLLGVGAVTGRLITTEDDKPGQQPLVVLGEALWQRRFHRSPEIAGQVIVLNGKMYTVVGVAPRSLDLLDKIDVFVTKASLDEKIQASGGNVTQLLNLVGKLHRGATPAQAADELTAILNSDNVRSANNGSLPGLDGPIAPPPGPLPSGNEDDTGRRSVGSPPKLPTPRPSNGGTASVTPLARYLIGDTRIGLLVLLAAVGFMLLVACANVANLMLARAAARQTEIAVRASVGASRIRLIRQLLVESLLLALLGGAAGIGLATLLTETLVRALPPTVADQLHGTTESGLDLAVLGFALAITIITGVAFGLAPAMAASKTNLEASLKKAGTRRRSGIGPKSLRGMLVIAELSLSLVLLTGSGLMVKSFIRLVQTPAGFRPAGLLTMNITLPDEKYQKPWQVSAFYDQILDRVRSLGDVRSAALADSLPLGGIWMLGMMDIQGAEPREPQLMPMADVRPGYFSTIGTPLICGRDFTAHDPVETTGLGLDEQDSGPRGPLIVNQAFVRTYWPSSYPIGKRIRGQEVIGVVADFKQQELINPVRPEVFVNGVGRRMSLAILSNSDPKRLIPAVRAQIAAVDPDQPLDDIKTMDERVAASMTEPRFYTMLMTIFAAISLLLAAAGVYSVMSFAVAERTQEIGIRMALGSSQTAIVSMVLKDAIWGSGLGIVIGLSGATALTRLISSYLYQVAPRDLATFTITALVLAGVALIACVAPARRAAQLDPIEALRYE